MQSGAAFHPGGRGTEVAVQLRSGLPDDGYTVTYRVISADAHPVSGGFVFVVGDAAAPSTTVDELLDDTEAGNVTGTAFGVVRAVQFGASARTTTRRPTDGLTPIINVRRDNTPRSGG